MKRYRLRFECISPFTKAWGKTERIVDEPKLAELKDQRDAQLRMSDVRNSVIEVQEIGEWEPLEETK